MSGSTTSRVVRAATAPVRNYVLFLGVAIAITADILQGVADHLGEFDLIHETEPEPEQGA